MCVVVSGLLVNAYLAVVARNVTPAEYGYFGAFWSLSLLVGFGAFLPVEQELARLSPAKAMGAATKVALGLAGVELLVVAAGSPLLLDPLGGRPWAVVAVAALCLVSAGQFLVRGALIGGGRLAWHGGLLVLDTALRVLFALGLGFAVTTDSAGFAWTLVAAIAVAHLPVLFLLPRDGSGEVSTSDFLRSALPLLLGSVCAQLLLNGLPVVVAAVATDSATAGRFLAAFLLVRVPLFVAVPLQTALLPSLTKLSQAGKGLLVRALAKLTAVLAAFGLAAAVFAGLLGPWVVRLVFGDSYELAGGDLVLMAVGVTAHLGLIVTTQALVASALHAKVAWSWLAGIASAAVVFALVPDLLLRAELSFLVGSGLGWFTGMFLLITSGEDRRARRPGHRVDLLRALRVRADQLRQGRR
ncbi:O-antigen/teichoic acid export membrane protein [Umezawaea tangerina]|uniref:O-antigen/teichoic acid export membrane protein n=1 Tax=Umezawaea tangerina TaxID=84725 RepID=A0A2T0SV63_9PSEU|nr:O-antigen/teichoic acid export membrane protein [Umezawaea tangerina]